jgi:hypothetical protein
MTSIIGDIRDGTLLTRAMQDSAPDIVIHMAAQPLVRRSYIDPVDNYSTNVMGTVYLLEAVRQTPSVRAVVNVTTDKCYENKEWVWGYRENEPMGGFDPYSSSKGCAELVTAAYRNSFFNTSKYSEHQVALATNHNHPRRRHRVTNGQTQQPTQRTTTNMSGFNVDKGARDMVPGFKFMRIGDRIKFRITDLDDSVEIEDKDKGVVRGTAMFLAIQGEVIKAVGGVLDDNDDVIGDVEAGEIRSILAGYKYRDLGSTEWKDKYSIISKAIAKAVTTAKASNLEVGGELDIHHHELGKRNAENPSWNRPKFYEAKYTPPAKSSGALTGAASDDTAGGSW